MAAISGWSVTDAGASAINCSAAFDRAFQRRHQLFARPAPRRPEIDDNRGGVRGLDDIGHKGRVAAVFDDVGHCIGHGALSVFILPPIWAAWPADTRLAVSRLFEVEIRTDAEAVFDIPEIDGFAVFGRGFERPAFRHAAPRPAAIALA